MALTVPDQGEPANDLQAVLFQSTLDAIAAGFARTGVVSGCGVAQQGSPDMTVAVAAGSVMLAGATTAVASGNVTIGTADATNPRLDLVVANGSGVKSVIAGAAAAAPKEPTLDTTTYVLLAQVYVPAAATTITTARITDRRVILTPPRRWADVLASGKYYATPGVTTTVGYGNSELYAVPYWFPETTIISSVGVEVTTSSVSGTGRLGIFAADVNGRPDALILDLGAIVGSSTGAVEVACSQAVGPGLVFFAYKTTANGTATALRSLTATGKPSPGNNGASLTAITAANAAAGYYGGTGSGTGAMPSNFSVNATAPWTGSMPLVAFKVA